MLCKVQITQHKIRTKEYLIAGTQTAYNSVAAHPSTLFGDPSCNLLANDKVNDEPDELGEDCLEATPEECHDDAVTEAEQDDDASPVDDAVAEQPAGGAVNETILQKLKTVEKLIFLNQYKKTIM